MAAARPHRTPRRFCVLSARVLLGILVLVPLSHAWIRAEKECPPGCTDRGNCNKEFGVCDCPPGWGGSICEEPLLGACRTKLDPSNMVMLLGSQWPKACECYRQIERVFNTSRDHRSLSPYGGRPLCYERTKLSASEQYSDMPDITEDGVEWYEGQDTFDNAVHKRTLEKLTNGPVEWQKLRNGTDLWWHVPLKHCKDRCNDRGWCWGPRPSAGQENTIKGHCQCTRGYTGSACEVETYYQDCTRTTAWAPDPTLVDEQQDTAYDRTHVKIFRYEIPWQVSFSTFGFISEYVHGHGALYEVEDLFLHTLLDDRHVLTENPYEANLFYVRADNIFYGDNINVNTDHMNRVLDWISHTYPKMWARHKGKDHMLVTINDLGSCQIDGKSLAFRLIKLSYWGPMENSELIQEHAANVYVRGYLNNCYNAMRDVVWPVPTEGIEGAEGYIPNASSVYKEVSEKNGYLNRTYLAYFAGNIPNDSLVYSGGARQRFAEFHIVDGRSKYSDIKVNGPMKDEAYKSDFCLIMAGMGFPNTRLTAAMHTACIPVIIMDHVQQPFHDLLPYPAFSIRVSHDDIPQLQDILRRVPAHTKAVMRRNMARYHHHFRWSAGGLAYNMTIHSLARRLQNLWAFMY